jgi:hypothetical protein
MDDPMASMAYFKKMREDDLTIFYAYGSDAKSLTSELIFNKASHAPAPLDAENLGYTGRKAAGKIIELYLEHGEWPEKGASVS